MRFEAILFDLDGTLIDSAPDLVQTLNDMLAEHGRPLQQAADLLPYMSYGSTPMLEVGFAGDYPMDFQMLRQQFLTRYKQQNTVKTDFFAGIEPLLVHIEQAQIPWGIITNKPTDCTLGIANKLKLNERAGAIVCGDTLPVAKPDPSPIYLACEMIGVNPANCVYIGDCIRDVEAGKNAEMATIACEYGYIGHQDESQIAAWGADYIAKTPADILSFITAN